MQAERKKQRCWNKNFEKSFGEKEKKVHLCNPIRKNDSKSKTLLRNFDFFWQIGNGLASLSPRKWGIEGRETTKK